MKYMYILFLSFMVISCQGKVENNNSAFGLAQSGITQSSPDGIKFNINVSEAKALIDSSLGIALLDVRTPEEIAQGKIGNAMEIDFSSSDFKEKVLRLDKNKEYIVYCESGARSSRAVSLMMKLGFSKVHNLTSGYNGWAKEK